METELVFYCPVDAGFERQGIKKHGMQIVQSIVIPENLYYLECGCIYKRNPKTGEFKLLRPHVQRCDECGVDVNNSLIIKNKNDIFCQGCGEGRAGTFETYRHEFVPFLIVAKEAKWKERNDREKLLRDNSTQINHSENIGENMGTEMKCWCTTDTGKHGLQNVQSVLVPENLYYLECGCIYKFNEKESEFTLLRPYVQVCKTCGKDVDCETVLIDGSDVWCMKCALGKTGTMCEYEHVLIPRFVTDFERRWKEVNDETKRKRDRDAE